MAAASGAGARPAASAASTRVPVRSQDAWRLGLCASAVLHGAAAAAILFSVVANSSSDKAIDAAMTVEIAPTPSAPPVPPRQTPPGPQQIQSVAKPRPLDTPKIPPPPQLTIPVKPEVVLPTHEQPQPDRPVLKQAADQTTAPQALVAPPKAQTAAPTMGAATNAANAPQTWEGLVLAKLQRNKRYPGAAQLQGQQDVVYVRMTIDRQGRLVEAKVVQSHGYPMLDSEVVALAHRASPYPAPPAAEEGDPIVVVVPIDFFVTRHRG